MRAVVRKTVTAISSPLPPSVTPSHVSGSNRTSRFVTRTLYDIKCKELEQKNQHIMELQNTITALQEKLSTCSCSQPKQTRSVTRGSMCSVNGARYEKQIHDVVRNCALHGNAFNSQNEKELGGSSASNDIECNFKGEKDIGIEIKKWNTPDWMQCSIRYNKDTQRWEGSSMGKIPPTSRKIFEEILNNSHVKLFNGKIPPFMERNITHKEWKDMKQTSTDWNDMYIDVPRDTIQRLYSAKGCYYIQVSDYGLYHLGEDVCGFNVPEFNPEQQLRIRTKIHTRKNAKGFCSLSVTVACQPKNLKSFQKSQYSLDQKENIPHALSYIGNMLT